MGPSIEGSGPRVTQTSSEMGEATLGTSILSQMSSTPAVSVESTGTAISSVTTASVSAHHSDSWRAFDCYESKALVMGLMFAVTVCLWF